MKKIYLVIETHRVKGSNEAFKGQKAVFACESEKEAVEDAERLNKMTNKESDIFIEFHYIVEEINLFLDLMNR